MAFIKLIKILVYRIILLAGFLQIYRLIFDYLKNESNYNFEYEKDTQLDQNFTAFRDFIEDQENQEIDQFITIEPDDLRKVSRLRHFSMENKNSKISKKSKFFIKRRLKRPSKANFCIFRPVIPF